MVVDFSKMMQRPKFILRNLDGVAIGYLNNVIEPSGKICYNEVSEISFDYPSQADGSELAEYELITSMRILDMQGYGQFILRNPVETDNGIVKMKQCKAYSLEYELANKFVSLEEGTYSLWNPIAPENTILGIIISEAKSWRIGTVSNDLIGKYRTFSVDNQNIYDWIKSGLQETYDCVFNFDTYNRTINVRSIKDIVSCKAVYLSTDNLIKELQIDENTDNLITALDVYGADGVTIRSVNPMGTNRIYNLDAYMNDKYLSAKIIESWNRWKDTFSSYQSTYYQLTIAQNMQISRYTTEESVLADLEGELSGLESKRAVIIQAIAVDKALESDLRTVNSEIHSKTSEINRQKEQLVSVQNEIDTLTSKLKEINAKTAFSSFFTEDELLVLDRYFKCGSLTDSTFVATSKNSYATDIKIFRGLSAIFNITNINSIQVTPYTNEITFYIIQGGLISANSESMSLRSEIVNGTLQLNADFTFVLSLYLSSGKFNDTEFPGGTVSMTGTLSANVVNSNTALQFKTASATLYLSQDVTEYQKMSVEQELYAYGEDYLKRLSSPTYYFSVSSVDFLALDDFENFAKELTLGEKIYIDTKKGVLTPIVVSVDLDFDNPDNFSINFGNEFTLNEASFTLEDLLDKSVSMGSSLDFNQYNYSNFVNSGAKTQVKDFMTSAIDTMKNRVLSGEHEEITVDRVGLRCRKYDEATSSYEPKQLLIAHNALMFTGDNWNSATIGIGEFVDKNLGSIFGVIAPAIVGTILAGSQLVIESEKQDGGVAVFKVDAEGASLHNASFNLYGSTGGRIDFGALYGIVAGADRNTLFSYGSNNQPTGVKTKSGDAVARISELNANDTPNANFWIDMYGDIYIKGTIDAVAGMFRGSLEVGGSTAFRVDRQGNMKIGGTVTNPNFSVDANGNLVAKSANIKGRVDATSLYINGRNILTNINANGNATNTSKISSGYLDLYGITITNASTGRTSFAVSSTGAVTINGNVTMGAGSSINWASITEVNPTSSRAYQQANSALNLANSANTNANSAYNQAVSASNAAWDAYDLAWENRLTDRNVFDVLTGGGTRFGIFSDSYSGRLYINANYIRSGTIDADIITLGSSWGGFSCAIGHDGVTDTYGAMMYGSNSNYYFIATNRGVRMQSSRNDFTVTNSGLYASEEIIISSDKRVKNSISYDMQHYRDFFMNLKPSFYRLNSGNSGRFHIGFIAQDIEQAIADAGISTDDFAGLVQSFGKDDVHDKFTDQYYLRYNNFIALNTYMIQELYHEIDELKKQLKEKD